MAMQVEDCDLLLKIQSGYEEDPTCKAIIDALKLNVAAKPPFSWSKGVLRRKTKIVVSANPDIKTFLLNLMHSSSSGGHSGGDATTQRIKSLFYWKCMANEIQAFIRQFQIYRWILWMACFPHLGNL